MTEISAEDFENVSLFAHHIALKSLFGVLADHDGALAADVARELARAKHVIPRIVPENLGKHVQTELQKWIDSLDSKNPRNDGCPHAS